MAKVKIAEVQRERFKVFNNIVELCKNITSDKRAYLTKDMLLSGRFNDERYNGAMFSRMDTSMLYIEEGTYYKLKFNEIPGVIKAEKLNSLKIEDRRLILYRTDTKTGEVGNFKYIISPIRSNSRKLYNFYQEFNKYYDHNDSLESDIDCTSELLDALDTELPIMVSFGEGQSVRITKQMSRCTYTVKKLISANYGYIQINEQLYIMKLNVERPEGILEHIYAVVPF